MRRKASCGESKNRMENAAEAQVETIHAQIERLQGELSSDRP
jgi:hypothetical protein